MGREEIERCIRDLSERAAQLVAANADYRERIGDNESQLVVIESALNEYYEQLELEAE